MPIQLDETRPPHPDVAAILRHFEDYAHLPAHLAEVSAPLRDVARRMAAVLDGPELIAGLRHLLEARHAFVRAAVPAELAGAARAAPAAPAAGTVPPAAGPA